MGCILILMNGQGVETQDRGLFSPVEPRSAAGGMRSPSAADSRMTIRSRLVRIDFDQLRTTRPRGARGAAARFPLRLNLFDDAVYPATVERVLPTDSGYALTGRLDDTPLGTITLVVNGSVVAGTVRSPAATYTIRSAGDGLYVIREVDLSQLPPEAEPLTPGSTGLETPRPSPAAREPAPPPDRAGRPRRGAGAPRPVGVRSAARNARAESPAARTAVTRVPADGPVAASQTDDGSVIDVIAFYTPAARDGEGGRAEIEALIDLFVAETNQALADSGVIQRINLVIREEVAYTEASRMVTDLRRIQNESDTYADDIHDIRDVYAADVVQVIIKDTSNGSCGIAGIMTEVSHDSEWWAGFSLTDHRCVDLTFAHELGHNFGLRHDRYHEDSVGDLGPTSRYTNKPYPYSYGYVNQEAFRPNAPESARWRTIMAYPSQCRSTGLDCARIGRFSNARQTWNGDSLGIAGDDISYLVTGPADAQRSLDDTRMTVANFRPSSDRAKCTYRVTPDRHVALAQAGTFEIKVTARPGCTWTVTSSDAFLSVTSGASGTGRGTVTYSVAPNDGARRRGILTIAGYTVTIDQIGPGTPGVCRRTRQVHEAIATRRGVACWEITPADLAFIERLHLDSTGLTSLRASDLAGLTNLKTLSLAHNRLTSVPSGVFTALANLEELYLSDNQLATLPPGAFAGLTKLRTLWLHRNRLTALPANAFAGLVNLLDLTLSTNRLSTLPGGVFGDLVNLEELGLRRNRLEAIPSGAFAGLDKLRELALGTNRITALPDGAFADLASLEYLSLANNEIQDLPAALFAGSANLRELLMWGNRLAALRADTFSDLANLERLLVSSNELTALPPGIFVGLTRLRELTLYNNPGSPFPLTLRLVHKSGNVGLPGGATVVVGVDSGAPFRMPVNVSAAGGALSATMATVPPGGIESAPLVVTQTGTAPVTVRLGPPPTVPRRFRGVSTHSGPPLVLVGPNRPPEPVGKLADVTLEVGEASATVEVAGAFRDPDGDRLTYGASSSAPAVASVAVAESRLAVTPVALGTATVTVTATDPGGSNTSATQRFEVRVLLPFTDHPIVPGETPVRAVHFTELRRRIDALRSAAGLGRFGWTNPVLRDGVTRVRLVHLMELRSALAAAYAAAGRAAPGWTDPEPVPGATPIKAVHVMELRAAVIALE